MKDDFKQIATDKELLENELDLGFEMLFKVIEKFADKQAEHLFYEFLSGPLECDVQAVAEMELFELVANVKEIADWDKWKSFLSSAIRSM